MKELKQCCVGQRSLDVWRTRRCEWQCIPVWHVLHFVRLYYVESFDVAEFLKTVYKQHWVIGRWAASFQETSRQFMLIFVKTCYFIYFVWRKLSRIRKCCVDCRCISSACPRASDRHLISGSINVYSTRFWHRAYIPNISYLYYSSFRLLRNQSVWTHLTFQHLDFVNHKTEHSKFIESQFRNWFPVWAIWMLMSFLLKSWWKKIVLTYSNLAKFSAAEIPLL